LAAGGVGAALTLGAWVAGASASDALLRAGPALWWGLQVAWASILGVATAVLLPRPEHAATPGGGARAMGWIAAGLALGGLLGAALVLARDPWLGAEPWFALAWAAPAYLVARGTPRLRFGGLRRWLVAGALAATALLPQLWLASADARLRGAEADVERLAAPTDPFIDFLMARLGAEARERYARGEGGAELLYRAWVGSGLAAEGYPVRLALWGPDGGVAERLDITGSGDDPGTGSGMAADVVRASREADLPIRRTDPSPEVRQAQAVPLGGGWVASALVLPRRALAPEGLAAAALGTRDARPATATLTLTASTTAGVRAEGLRWAASVAGVRGEGELRLGDVLYHAHVEVDQAPAAVRIARGVLLIVVDLLALALIWGFAHNLAGSPRPPPAPWIPAPGSFRSRVTLALFFFFLVPTLAFGAVAYRTVAGAAEREAEATVSRSSAQAVDVFAAAGGNLQTVAGLVGLDVLFYQGGELITSSRPELVRLGVHDAWLAPDAHIALREGEALALDRGRSLLGRRAVVGFRRLAPAGVVGIPALPGGAAAARRAELTDTLLFAILLGAVLSLALSLAAGRALARPIGQLSRAASAVGEGRSRVDLPVDRRDEFGELFRSFNRMTRGLRRARARELRSARVLAWGEMARQVAHEIKNPLTPIRLSVQHVRRAFRDERQDFGEILEGNVEQVLHEIDRLSDIARAFARYGAPAEPQPALESVDVEAVALDVQALYASGERGMVVRVESEPDLPSVAARDGELREVLINLLENAREALPEGGVARVTVRREGAEVALQISDGGEGIPADVLPSVFEPHFSTRSSGTGLGLAIVKRLVEDWGGRIIVESEPGRGTAFKIWLKEAEAGGAD
ncbi:MAG: HAMP domain-containing sensor histidine kinase, partial [Gemmatimonadota bacterium]